MIDILEIKPGNSYAAKFKVNNQEKLGILLQRDLEKKLVKIVDVESTDEHIVAFDDIWDIDDVEWVDSE